MAQITPFLLLVLAGFAAFVAALLIVSLRCWGLEAPRGGKDAILPPVREKQTDHQASDRAAA